MINEITLALIDEVGFEIDYEYSDPIIVSKMFKELANGDLNLAQLNTLINKHPEIIQPAISAMQSISDICATAGNSQSELSKAIYRDIDGRVEVLLNLAQRAESDSTREKIADIFFEQSKSNQQIIEIIERMNKDNNSLFDNAQTKTTIISTIAGVLGFGLGAGAMYLLTKDDKNKS